MCLLRYPPWTNEMPLRVWGLPGQPVLSGLSPIPPSLVSPGVWTHPAHRLVSHIRSSLLEAEIPQETPMHTHRERTQGYPGGMGEGTWPWLELPCYLSVPLVKGPEASRGFPEPAPTVFSHTWPVSSLEAPSKTSRLPANLLGSPLHCEAWRSGFRVLFGSVARK